MCIDCVLIEKMNHGLPAVFSIFKSQFYSIKFLVLEVVVWAYDFSPLLPNWTISSIRKLLVVTQNEKKYI